MALVTIAAAKGAPGVTTTALVVGALWPRPIVLAECDPAGGDVALRMPGADGQPLDRDTGLVSLVAAGRKSFYPGLVSEHSQQLVGGLDVLLGVKGAEQAAGIARWDELARMLSRLDGTDVVADLGRIGAATPQNAFLAAADAVVYVVDTVPSNVVHLRERLRRLYADRDPGAPAAHVVVVAPAKRVRAVREVAEALEGGPASLAAVHHLAHDPSGAAYFLGQIRGNPARTHLVRTSRPLVERLAAESYAGFVAPASHDVAVPAPIEEGTA